ncbi:hypothetical protein BJ878DRAFT_200583 [Calycina marina]|uniref:Uncharacterized protein n=1 Tax=Calycina marina TaxID=1763456 RepID=A0A9P7ZBW5_9HELO|nr:hypothetical protein BJ878DRAFT_200583 [Calycina marina]
MFEESDMLKTCLGTSAQIHAMDANTQTKAAKSNPYRTFFTSINSGQVRNASIADDIEELSLNATLSILSDTSLCYNTSTVNTRKAKLIYLYKPMNLVIVHISILTASAEAVLLGAFALRLNGAVYVTNVSTISINIHSPEVGTMSYSRVLCNLIGSLQIKEALGGNATAVQGT